MRFLINGDLIDLEAPFYATDEQRNKIVAFFKDEFPDIKVENVIEPDREYSRTSTINHKWNAKDFLQLFSSKTNREIADELGLKTSMGPQIKRGYFVMSFLNWKKENAQEEIISEKLLQAFLDEADF